jgi:hypothetical protein
MYEMIKCTKCNEDVAFYLYLFEGSHVRCSQCDTIYLVWDLEDEEECHELMLKEIFSPFPKDLRVLDIEDQLIEIDFTKKLMSGDLKHFQRKRTGCSMVFLCLIGSLWYMFL